MKDPRAELLHQALHSAKENDYNGILLVGTGAGKGRMMIEIAKILKPKSILYLCNSTELRDNTFKHELHKWDASYLIPYIDFQCYQTAYKYIDKEYDLLLADEFDYSLTPEYSKVYFNNKFTNRIFVSATLDDTKKSFAKTIGNIIFERKQVELIKDKVLNKIQFYFVNYNLSPAENKKYLYYNDKFKELLIQPPNYSRERKLDYIKIARKQFLSNLITSANVTKWIVDTLKPKAEKILIFCGLSEQADRVCKNAYYSENKNIEAYRKFETGEIKELAVVEKVTRGENITNVRNIIFNTVDSGKTRLTQKIGRGLRLKQDETLKVFFQVPYFKHPFYGRKATVIQDWITNSTKDMDLTNAKYVNYQPPC